MLIALTRAISPALAHCELSHLPRVPIDLERARAQHRAYEQALEEAGCTIERLPADSDMPDSVFIEDIALVFDELAVMTRPGAESRRKESVVVEDAVGRFRPLRRIEAPATLDGGDVLVLGRHVWVGESARTNRLGVRQLDAILQSFGYSVVPVRVTGCLHLKSAATAVGDGLLLINHAWIERGPFAHLDCIEVDSGEPYAANALILGARVVYPAAFPRTRERLERAGADVRVVDASELAKAEGGVTCCSVIFKTGRNRQAGEGQLTGPLVEFD